MLSGELELDRLPELPDGEVIRELTAVKGIGEWTAHMFLIFTLNRPDVLPIGDLGVRNAAMRAYGLERPPAPAELTALAEPWRPAPHARLPVPLAEPRQRTGLTLATLMHRDEEARARSAAGRRHGRLRR